jgi:ketosteroid isomerase-like protein
MLNKLVIILLVVGFLLGCSQQNVVKQFSSEELKTEINSLNNTIAKAVMEGNYELTTNMYKEDCISLPSYQPMLRGKAAIIKQAEMEKQNAMKMENFVLTSTDIWQNGNLVVDVGTYSFSMDMPQMPGGVFKDQGKYITIYEVQADGTLLIKADTWNTDTNPWMQMGQN